MLHACEMCVGGETKASGRTEGFGGGLEWGPPYSGYYAGWVNEDQQMKAIRLPAGGTVGVVQREAARENSVFRMWD